MARLSEAAVALRAASKATKAATARSVAQATRLVADTVLVGQARAGAGSGRLRNAGRGGAPIGVRGTVRGGTGLVRTIGPAWLLDHPTKPHTEKPRQARALNTPAGPRASVKHPGTRGKPYFEESVAEASPKVAGIFAANEAEALRKTLG